MIRMARPPLPPAPSARSMRAIGLRRQPPSSAMRTRDFSLGEVFHPRVRVVRLVASGRLAAAPLADALVVAVAAWQRPAHDRPLRTETPMQLTYSGNYRRLQGEVRAFIAKHGNL